ncbi:MAG: DUF2169 domain-containing protein [Polyangiaceae bacterium]
MKVAKPLRVPILSRTVEVAGVPTFHVAAMLGFPLESPRKIFDELAFWRLVTEELAESAIDECVTKARAEVLVAGSFHARGGQPIPASFVHVRVGSFDKRLAVLGDREWRHGVPSTPAPMTTMRIDWAHAFGGPKIGTNPYGKGADKIQRDGREVLPLPNVELYGKLMMSAADRPMPGGFLPQDITFSQRRSRAGSYDAAWMEKHYPGMPADTHPTFFNVGAEDQWLASDRFGGDEAIRIENMHPDKPVIEGRLPGLRMRVFVTHRRSDGEAFVELPAKPDTLWLFPSKVMGVLVYHASLEVADDDGKDIVHLLVACEENDKPGRSVEHYHEALLRRLDKDKGAQAELVDHDIMPSRESGIAPNLIDSEMNRWVASENLVGKQMREGAIRKKAEIKADMLAKGMDPSGHGLDEVPELPELNQEDPNQLVVELDAMAKKSAEMMEAARAQSAKAVERARQEYAEQGLDYDQMLEEDARKHAGPPRTSARAGFEEMERFLAVAREAGYPRPELEAEFQKPHVRAFIENQDAAALEHYRQHAHFQPAALPASVEDSELARAFIPMAQENQEPLARRNFTGMDLHGISFAGVDLTETLFEGADLRGCDFRGAKLTNAVLARALLAGADFTGAELQGANLGATELAGVRFDRANLTGAILSRAKLDKAVFAHACLDQVNWRLVEVGAVDVTGASLLDCSWTGCNLAGAHLGGANMRDATLVECQLDGADFTGANLEKATFVACKGEHVPFVGATLKNAAFVHHTELAGADFSDAKMEKVNLRGTLLRGARFDRAHLPSSDLSECDLKKSSLERANLKGSLLIRTVLEGASLRGANLMDVILSKARIAGADFTGSNLFQADLSRTVGDDATSFAESEVARVRYLPKARTEHRT